MYLGHLGDQQYTVYVWKEVVYMQQPIVCPTDGERNKSDGWQTIAVFC